MIMTEIKTKSLLLYCIVRHWIAALFYNLIKIIPQKSPQQTRQIRTSKKNANTPNQTFAELRKDSKKIKVKIVINRSKYFKPMFPMRGQMLKCIVFELKGKKIYKCCKMF